MEAKAEVTNLITPLINAYKAINDEWSNQFNYGLNEYLHHQTYKYYLINTFIHRSEKVKFYDIYFPVKVKYRFLETQFDNIEDVLSEYKNITIVGSAGSGKTTLIKHIFLNTIKEKKRIPVLVELRSMNDFSGSLEELIFEKIIKVRVKPNENIMSRTLKKGMFLFLLDGYDEIISSKKQNINRQIELFVDSYPENWCVVTTRPGSGMEGFTNFYDFNVMPLGSIEIDGFVNKIVENEERRSRILDVIGSPDNISYRNYLSNPLLLSMFIMAFESHPEIPKYKSAFYRNVFDTLYAKHDGITKNSFPREKLTKLQKDDFEKILSIFSYISYTEGKLEFTHEYLFDKLSAIKKNISSSYDVENIICDLRTAISILVLDGFVYSFPHRSMQEYFLVIFVKSLSTQKKEKAFKSIIATLQNSNDRSNNILTLFNEIDYISLCEFFLLPILNDMKSMLENENSDTVN